MKSRYKIIEGNYPHFVTSTIVEWLPVFTKDIYFNIIIESLKFCRSKKGLKVHAYVILDNHLHMIISGEHLAKTIKEFKMFTARKIIDTLKENNVKWLLTELEFYKKRQKINSQYQVWQEGYHPQVLDTDTKLEQKIGYTHNNPVKRGLVRKQEDWIYSSARDFAGFKSVMEIDKLFV